MFPSLDPAYVFNNCVGKNTPENSAEPAPRKIPKGSPRLKTIAKLAERIPRQTSTTVVNKRKTRASKKLPLYCTPKNTQPKKRYKNEKKVVSRKSHAELATITVGRLIGVSNTLSSVPCICSCLIELARLEKPVMK